MHACVCVYWNINNLLLTFQMKFPASEQLCFAFFRSRCVFNSQPSVTSEKTALVVLTGNFLPVTKLTPRRLSYLLYKFELKQVQRLLINLSNVSKSAKFFVLYFIVKHSDGLFTVSYAMPAGRLLSIYKQIINSIQNLQSKQEKIVFHLVFIYIF